MTTILPRPSVEELRRFKNDKNTSFPVIAIEPRPHQAKLLRREPNDDRIIILEKELDTNDGWSDFYIYDAIRDPYYRHWNLSSMHEFSDNVIDRLTFFRVSENRKNHIKHVCENPTKTIVETIRLDTII